jgi:hypothetical protein
VHTAPRVGEQHGRGESSEQRRIRAARVHCTEQRAGNGEQPRVYGLVCPSGRPCTSTCQPQSCTTSQILL